MNYTLEFVKFLHTLIDISLCSYIFIASPVYDIYYAIVLLLQTLHWGALKNECIVTYIEKKLIDPKYELGSKIKWKPHVDTYYNLFTRLLKDLVILGTLITIIIRADNNHIEVISVLAIILWMYYTYFYKSNKTD